MGPSSFAVAPSSSSKSGSLHLLDQFLLFLGRLSLLANHPVLFLQDLVLALSATNVVNRDMLLPVALLVPVID